MRKRNKQTNKKYIHFNSFKSMCAIFFCVVATEAWLLNFHIGCVYRRIFYSTLLRIWLQTRHQLSINLVYIRWEDWKYGISIRTHARTLTYTFRSTNIVIYRYYYHCVQPQQKKTNLEKSPSIKNRKAVKSGWKVKMICI